MLNEEPVTLDARFLGDLRSLQDESTPGFIAQLIDLYLAQGSEMVGELKSCLRSRNSPGLARVAHTFKGSSGCIGAMRLRALCTALETDPMTAGGPSQDDRIAEIETEFERVRLALEEARKS